MNVAAFSDNLPLIAILVVLIIFQFLMRRRRNPDRAHAELVRYLILDVTLNQRLAEVFPQQTKPRKFLVLFWRMNQKKFDFLSEPLQTTLANAFSQAQEVNQQLSAAKKQRSAGYLTNIDLNQLSELLAKSKNRLEDWLQVNASKNKPPSKLASWLDILFGIGR